jgi:hypothetical protein
MATQARRTQSERLDAIEAKLDRIDLNGHGPALKKMLDDWPVVRDTVAAIAGVVPQLVEVATERKESEITWRTLQRWFRWGKGTRAFLQTVATFAVGVVLYAIVHHIWPHTPLP